MDVDRRPGRRGEPPVARDVVRVGVGLEDVLDADADVAREHQVHVGLEARIDDRGDACPLVADQVRRATQIVVGDLPEDHLISVRRIGSRRASKGEANGISGASGIGGSGTAFREDTLRAGYPT